MVEYFHKGGPIMWPLLAIFGIGMIFVIIKFWILFRSKIKKKKFLSNLMEHLGNKDVDQAVEMCEETRGPIASVIHAALLRAGKGLDQIERAIENAAAIEMSFLEKGMWVLSTIVSVAPMLGFLGTVYGMILSFRKIAEAGDIIPSQVAGGISIALITTLSGLAIAIPIQFFYNVFVNMVDNMVIDMEDSANSVVEKMLEEDLAGEE